MDSSVSKIVRKKKTERMSETLGGRCVKYFLTEKFDTENRKLRGYLRHSEVCVLNIFSLKSLALKKENCEDISDTRRSVSAADLPFGGEKN